ncbi:hypothetical protein [Deinococcus pimensis]|uniref:hypothetical protein n=1 Tax=Deinococcus pimensis TaxID=309888 RepID=UPI000488EB76|nr:hypothetical protein [Deinococcus pimensis]
MPTAGDPRNVYNSIEAPVQVLWNNQNYLKTQVEARETPAGAQAKANQALADAKTYADAKVGSIQQETPVTIRDKLVQADGANSGIDADLLDGFHASYFASQAAFAGHNHDDRYALAPGLRVTKLTITNGAITDARGFLAGQVSVVTADPANGYTELNLPVQNTNFVAFVQIRQNPNLPMTSDCTYSGTRVVVRLRRLDGQNTLFGGTFDLLIVSY